MNIELVKKFNKTSILRTIRDKEPISRSEISELMNLARPSVSDIVTELIQEGWVRELNSIKGGRGRRPIPLEINPDGKFIIGVELGVRRVEMILCNLHANILASHEFEFDNNQVTFILEQICSGVEDLIMKSGVPFNKILGIGIAMHGVVDPVRGVSILAPNLGWRDVSIAKEIQEKTKLMTIVENDCMCSALAESWFGLGKASENFVTLLVNYGIGSSFFLDGKIYRGMNNASGRVGHITVSEEGPKCVCGNYGCLETMASETAIVSMAVKRLRIGEDSILHRHLEHGLRIQHIYQGANLGDPLSLDVLKIAGRFLGLGVSHIINTLDPEAIIIGGGIVHAAKIIIPTIREIINRRVLSDKAKKTPILVSHLQEHLYPIGAATLILERCFQLPTVLQPSLFTS